MVVPPAGGGAGGPGLAAGAGEPGRPADVGAPRPGPASTPAGVENGEAPSASGAAVVGCRVRGAGAGSGAAGPGRRRGGAAGGGRRRTAGRALAPHVSQYPSGAIVAGAARLLARAGRRVTGVVPAWPR